MIEEKTKMSMIKNEKEAAKTENTRPDGMVMQIVTSLICILIGGLMLFVPDVNMLYICYCFCAALIVVGITLIVSYFVTNAYKKLNDYRFATGVLLVIMGCIELMRAKILAEEITFIMGLVALVLSVIIMQSTVQMKILESGAWIVQLILTIVSLVGSISVLTDFGPVMAKVDGFEYWVMLVVGVLCLISLIIEAIVLWQVGKKEAKEVKEVQKNQEEVEVTEKPQDVSRSDDAAISENGINIALTASTDTSIEGVRPEENPDTENAEENPHK